MPADVALLCAAGLHRVIATSLEKWCFVRDTIGILFRKLEEDCILLLVVFCKKM